MPYAFQPRPWAESTTARITAFRPGASPPPVEMAIRMSAGTGDQRQDLPGLGVAPKGLLGKDQRAVHRDFEGTTGRRDQPDLGIGDGLLQLSRQTGSSLF